MFFHNSFSPYILEQVFFGVDSEFSPISEFRNNSVVIELKQITVFGLQIFLDKDQSVQVLFRGGGQVFEELYD